MNYRLVEKNSFKIVGVMETAPINETEVFIPSIHQTTHENLWDNFEQRIKTNVDALLYVAVSKTEKIVDYFIGFEAIAECPDSLVELEISMQTWAVFEIPSLSSRVINNTWYRLFTEWFPTHGYELVENVQFFREIKDVNWYELWIPVTKSKYYQKGT